MTRIVAVVGSPTAGGRTRAAIDASVAAALTTGPNMEAEVFELAETKLAGGTADISGIIESLQKANGVLLGTPIYRGSYTGTLKTFLDAVPTEALEAKPVALVATGASAHHYFALDRDLRGVLTWFNAYVLPGATYLVPGDFPDGKTPAAEARESLEQLGRLLGDLATRLAGAPLPPPTLQSRAAKAARQKQGQT